MIIPTRNECLSLMHETSMPLHIQKHCLMVTAIAVYLGARLKDNGIELNMELIEAGALLHDIAKPQSLTTGERHNELGAKMVLDWGYLQIAPIVREHVFLDMERATGPFTEALIVNYSDKRVKHDRIVTLEERFEDLIVRYTKTPEQGIMLRERMRLYTILEARLFERLTISPTETELMLLSAEPEYEWEEHEREKIDCGATGRRQIG